MNTSMIVNFIKALLKMNKETNIKLVVNNLGDHHLYKGEKMIKLKDNF